MKRIAKIVSILLVLLIFTILTPKSLAVGEGLTISPPMVELEAEAGKSYDQIIKITNPTQNLIEVYPTVMNFRASGEGGEPAFYPISDEEENYSIGHWVEYAQNKIAIMPEQVVEFKYQIKVAENAEPGGHYGVLFFATTPPKAEEGSNQISISSMIGSLILVKVKGTIIEKGYLEKFFTNLIFIKTPVVFVYRISNLGNIHFKPKGEISIKNIFDDEVDKISINSINGNVLPDSTRKYEEKWEPKNKLLFGRYTADLRAVYGESEKTLSSKIAFYIFPIWFIIVFSVVVISLVLLILLIRKRKRRFQI